MSEPHADPFRLSDPAWLLAFEGWDPAREPAIEAICAMVNGYCGVRAAVEEGSAASGPGTYLNGVFDAAGEAASQASVTPEHAIVAAPTSELVRAPEWSGFRLAVDGARIELDDAELLAQRRTLDLARGVLVREWTLRTRVGTTRLRSLRFVSLSQRHLLGQIVEISPEDWSGEIDFAALLDADVTNDGGGRHLVDTTARSSGHRAAVTAVTATSRVEIAMVAGSRLFDGDREASLAGNESGAHAALQRWRVAAEPGRVIRFEKVVAVSTSRDGPDPLLAADAHLDAALRVGVAELVAESADAWAERWRDADVRIGSDETVQRQTRFAIYHLIGSANPDDERASPGARALTGERYKGHVFWDTEIFVLPFFVFTHPPSARSLLMYRFHTLPAARDRAASLGYRGALYAWESTDSGADLTPPFVINSAGERLEILTGEQEHHISADVAYAVCRYWDATGDDEFLLSAGAEILFEVARFWCSRATVGSDGRHHILRVIGPDEYHENVDDNAYTNQLARFALRRASAAASWMRGFHPSRWRALVTRLGLDDAEIANWSGVSEGLVDGRDGESLVIEQHRGFSELAAAELDSFEPRSATMDVLMGWERLVGTQILKQADVLMLPTLLPDEMRDGEVEANYDHYEPRTSHDSSLSAAVHALVAARIGRREDAVRYFKKAATIDLDLDRGVTAAGGIHIAALGGMWQALVFGFAGAITAKEGVDLRPDVPDRWGEVEFALRWRGAPFACRAEGTAGEVTP
ncbi:MAG: glycoside hydrolase family 65 protein [Miltoncostaeaceae bacterium]